MVVVVGFRVLGPSDTGGAVRDAVGGVSWVIAEENAGFVFGALVDAHEGMKDVDDVEWGVGPDGVCACDTEGGY